MGASGAIGTANAAPLSVTNPQPMAAAGQVETVQHREYRHRGHRHRPRFKHRRHWRHHNRRWDRHHGWRHHRRHYRPRYGWGVRPHYRGHRPRYRRPAGSAHVRWCYNRYRSYRAYDNSYQPYNGPRRQCYSPFI
ncbi:BA14K family protein [Phyllobacterium phragmitis]